MDAELRVGERVQVFGGYDHEPAWLVGHPEGFVTGVVSAFIPGQNGQAAAVVALDEELALPEGAGSAIGTAVRGRFVVLELGHVGADWTTPEPRVHVELCAEPPAHKRWTERVRGAWIESHATWRRESPRLDGG